MVSRSQLTNAVYPIRPFVMIAKLAKKHSHRDGKPSFFLGRLFGLLRQPRCLYLSIHQSKNLLACIGVPIHLFIGCSFSLSAVVVCVWIRTGFSAFIDTFIDSFASLQFLLFTINRAFFYSNVSIHDYGLKRWIYL